MKINYKVLSSNLVSLANLWSLFTIFNSDDSPSIIRYFYYVMMILAIAMKYIVQQLKSKNLFLYLLDIDTNMFVEDKRNQQQEVRQAQEEADVIKMCFFIIYNYYLLQKNEIKISYAVGLFLTQVDHRIRKRKEGFSDQFEMTIYQTTHIIIFRYFYINSTWTEFVSYFLILLAIIIVVLFLVFGPSKFAFDKSYFTIFMTCSFVGRCEPTFQERKFILEKEESEQIAQMQGFFAVSNLILAYYYYDQMNFILLCFLIVFLPIALMKIYRQICVFAYGPFQVQLDVDQSSQVKQLIKLRQYQYIVKFNFKELAFQEIKYFIRRFVAINPQVYYEIAFNNQSLLQFQFLDHGERLLKRLYTLNYQNIESIQLQIEAFFMSKVMSQEQNLEIDFQILYQKYQRYNVDKILLDIDNIKLCPAVKSQGPSHFMLCYLKYRKSVVMQKICFQKNITDKMIMNSNEIFYDLFDI